MENFEKNLGTKQALNFWRYSGGASINIDGVQCNAMHCVAVMLVAAS
jgi:hypothetical protein